MAGRQARLFKACAALKVGRAVRQTEAQLLLAQHLKELGIATVPEYRFDPERQFRFDLASLELRMGFECNGHFAGKHGKGWSEESEKMNLAQMQGWRVLSFHNRDVLTGKAKDFVSRWMAKEVTEETLRDA